MLENTVIVEKENIVKQVIKMKEQHYRFAAMTCEQVDQVFEITYHFDLNYENRNLRILVKVGETVESISSIYSSAFLIENEFQDLYGIVFENLIIDYKGKLYLTSDSPKTPMLKGGN